MGRYYTYAFEWRAFYRGSTVSPPVLRAEMFDCPTLTVRSELDGAAKCLWNLTIELHMSYFRFDTDIESADLSAPCQFTAQIMKMDRSFHALQSGTPASISDYCVHLKIIIQGAIELAFEVFVGHRSSCPNALSIYGAC